MRRRDQLRDRLRDPAVRRLLRGELRALMTGTALLVLLGAPAGLLWARLAPRVDVVVTATEPAVAGQVRDSQGLIAVDGTYLLVVLAAGVLSGAVAWLLARLPGPGPGPGLVLGLLVGGVLAALVAVRTGQQVGREEFQAALRSAEVGAILRASPRLASVEAVVGWPLGALTAFLGLSVVTRR